MPRKLATGPYGTWIPSSLSDEEYGRAVKALLKPRKDRFGLTFECDEILDGHDKNASLEETAARIEEMRTYIPQ